MLERFPSLRRILIMVQAEVADRLAAEPGGRVYGVPSVKARWYADVRRAGSIGRNVFWPAPHVESGLVALDRREPPRADVARTAVFAVVDAAFAQRRKTLRAALGGWAGSRPGPRSCCAAPEWIPARAGSPWAWQSMPRSRRPRAAAERSRRSLRRDARGGGRVGDGAGPVSAAEQPPWGEDTAPFQPEPEPGTELRP